jgi:hypothetical protein
MEGAQRLSAIAAPGSVVTAEVEAFNHETAAVPRVHGVPPRRLRASVGLRGIHAGLTPIGSVQLLQRKAT